MLRETHQDLVVRSSDFRMEKSAWERPLWIVVLHLIYNKKKQKQKQKKQKRKNCRLVRKTKKFESQMKTELETRSSQLVDDVGSKNY